MDRFGCPGGLWGVGGGIVREHSVFDVWSEHSVFDVWSDRIFLRAIAETGYPVAEMFWQALIDAVRNAIRDPKNWGPPIRFRRTPQMLRQAARVTRALRRAKPGELVRL